MYDWNDIKYFLAVARDGSTLAASRTLKVSQATVSRRISLFEEELGVELFVRTAAGYALTARGSALVPLAEKVEATAVQFSDGVEAEARRLSGLVRLTTVESAANAWVIPAVARLHEHEPDVHVEIVSSDANLDLARGEADVAIRFAARPEDEALIVRHLCDLEEAAYASRELVTRLGRPTEAADLSRYPLVTGIPDNNLRFSDWITEHVPAARIVHRVNSISGIIASVHAGIGAALLPCIIGDNLKGVVRLMPPIPELATPCWMVTTDQARRQPHIRAVIDCVVDYVERATTPRRSEEGELKFAAR